MARGVDVINFSMGVDGINCNPSPGSNYDFFNQTLVNAVNAGVVFVASTGDDFHVGLPCNVSYPANRTETIAVGELSSYDYTVPYNQLAIDLESPRGGMPIRTSHGDPGYLSSIALLAPGYRNFLYDYDVSTGTSLYGSPLVHGTSLSAPNVAGAIGLMRHAFASIGMPLNDARALMVNALLMGDGYNGSTIMPALLDPVAGAGRMIAHWPSSDDLTAPWAWGWRAVHLDTNNQVFEWPVGNGQPLPSSVTQWKWATLFTWNDPSGGAGGLQDVPDIDYTVFDKCTGQILFYDGSTDVRSRFKLNHDELAGHCLWMRATAYSVPPGGATFYSADYYHSGDPTLH